MARSWTKVAYEKAEANISSLDKNALAWHQDVDPGKHPTAHSPCPRYNTLTSNNVEAVNSVFKGIRSLPVIDCLMGIERYVACKWAENVSKGKRWGVLTPYASRKVDKILAAAKWGEIDECSTSCFIVAIRSGVWNIPVKFAVQFCDKVVRCSCGYFEDVGSPCVHALLALRHSEKLPNMVTYFHDSWKSSTFAAAYSERSEDKILPLVLKDVLTRGVCNAPSIMRKKGRPKKERIRSQQATEKLEKRRTRCGMCNHFGHNRRTCPIRDA